MNALNILSGLGGPPKSRSSSLASISIEHKAETDCDSQSSDEVQDGQAEPTVFDSTEQTRSRARKVPRRVVDAVIGFLRWLLAVLTSPAYYLGSVFIDDSRAKVAPSLPLSRLFRSWRKQSSQPEEHHPSQGTRSKTAAQEMDTSKRSIKIKLHEDTSRLATALKSPASGSIGTKLRYPRAPIPPRPLVPRRQPSFTNTPMSTSTSKKTLIIDLDETLIHSMAKGGRMSTGHMVEVKIATGVPLGPQVPILYYVHERPYCHEFLRKVCKWYNLIIFTASVQEYADPVIDWLERERAYFSGRYYRQHCTYRNGAYIKDLSHVEPDLSKVMILDNSPMSYIFHEGTSLAGRPSAQLCEGQWANNTRQCSTNRRVDQRPDGPRLATSGAVLRGSTVRDRRAGIVGVEIRPGGLTIRELDV